MLYLIGLGMEIKDLSLNALECIKKCRKVYLENYTSIGCSLNDLKRLIKKEIVIAEREIIENCQDKILNEAKKQDIAILVYGDPLIATTHINYIIDAQKIGVKTRVVHNVSIFNAVTETGLMIYNFGKTASIPFDNENIKTPIKIIKNNLKMGLHTLILLDLDPKNNKFLTINNALEYLMKNNFLDKRCITCVSLGKKNQKIKYGKIKDLIKLNFKNFPQCIIVPGKLHFREEEALKLYNIEENH